EQFEHVIFDLPPVNVYSDASIIGPRLDAALIVIEADRTRIPEVERTRRSLDRVGVRLVGSVLNRRRSYIPAFIEEMLEGRAMPQAVAHGTERGTPAFLRVAIALAFPFIAALTVAGTYFNQEVIVAALWVAMGTVGILFVRPIVGLGFMTAAYMLTAYPTA